MDLVLFRRRSASAYPGLPLAHKLLVCGTLLLPLVVFLLLSYKSILGYRETGEVATASDVPVVGRHFSTFRTDGPVAFTIFYHPHGSYSCLLCGFTSEQEVSAVCTRLGLDAMPGNGEDFNTELRSTLERFDEETRGVFSRGSFAQEDWCVLGRNANLGQVSGAFRVRDGYFAIHLVGNKYSASTGRFDERPGAVP